MLFSAPMITALFNGTKTETRRVFAGAPDGATRFERETPTEGFWMCIKEDGSIHPQHFGTRTQVGDLIWAKEAHYAYGQWRTIPDTFTKKTGKPKREFVRDQDMEVEFQRDWIPNEGDPKVDGLRDWYKRSSLFLPKADSRLTSFPCR